MNQSLSPSAPAARVAFHGDYLPRQCGIATFTTDLRTQFRQRFPESESFVVAVEDHPGAYDYPAEVRYTFSQENRREYAQAARYLNESGAEVVSIQHEYGIYGGESGRYLLDLVSRLTVPVVTTFHTVLEHPSATQEQVMRELAALSARVVVMSEKGRFFLEEVYGIETGKIAVIPHGIPDVAFLNPDTVKPAFGLDGRKVVLTFGLISPNKGIETAIAALPAVVEKHPELMYVVLGATHPNLVREQGESYREQLIRLATELGVGNHIRFENQFVSQERLIDYLQMADVYLTPYLNQAQITSGTLAYSVGCGKAVVSTPYWHAEELLADGRGMLVPFRSETAISEALIHLFDDPAYREELREKAYAYSRPMVWSETVDQYRQLFSNAVPRDVASLPDALPPLKLDHLFRLTDSTGILQHARYTLPHREEGYCTDDTARALLLLSWLDADGEIVDARIPWMIDSYASFLNHAFLPETGRFRNFMSYGREWLETTGSDDSHGRALWAVGGLLARTRRSDLRNWARDLFHRALPVVLTMHSPRAWAFTMLGITEYLHRYPGEVEIRKTRTELGNRLCRLFRQAARPHWHWFEPVLSYDNARLPQALLCSDQPEHQELGLHTLEWLRDIQTAPEGHFRPVGSDGVFVPGQAPALFDQQPLEAAASVGAYLAAFAYSGQDLWREAAVTAFQWYLGRNDTGLYVYDEVSGGCYDGLQPGSVNLNQGAESCLSYLMARSEIRAVPFFSSIKPISHVVANGTDRAFSPDHSS
ncbi:MAG: glycosyltransferase family 4 protein [Siphonobacter aquaeclarae]|nr:glycosyltransferase family 4 protein [Siphonobacter aquaeclarae]